MALLGRDRRQLVGQRAPAYAPVVVRLDVATAPDVLDALGCSLTVLGGSPMKVSPSCGSRRSSCGQKREGMRRAAFTFNALASLAMAGCSSGSGPDAGPDAGVLYSCPSSGPVILSGAAAGSWDCSAISNYEGNGDIVLPDGGVHRGSFSFIMVHLPDVPDGGDDLLFDFSIFDFSRTELQTGTFRPGDFDEVFAHVTFLDGGYFPDGGHIYWGNIVTFELTVTSTGPVDMLGDDAGSANWFGPSANLTVYFAPNPGATVGVLLGATVEPPDCSAHPDCCYRP